MASLPLHVQEAEQLMLMMRGSGCLAADHVQEAVQLMLMMRGSGSAAPHDVQELTQLMLIYADDASGRAARLPIMCKKLRS